QPAPPFCDRAGLLRRPLPTRRSSDLTALLWQVVWQGTQSNLFQLIQPPTGTNRTMFFQARRGPSENVRLEANLSTNGEFTFRLRSEEHTSELQSRVDVVCSLLLENKN